jgi:hypothetical protein
MERCPKIGANAWINLFELFTMLSESKIEYLWIFAKVFVIFYYQNFGKIQQKFSEVSWI